MKKFGLTITSLTNLEAVEGLHHAVDSKFERLLIHARAQWEKKIATPDPSDACVSVRITPAAPQPPERPATRGSGFVKSTKKNEPRSKFPLRGFAH